MFLILHFIRGLYYQKIVNLERGIHAHKASNTPPIDERFNFGKKGSAASYIPRIFPPRIYEENNNK